MKRFTAVVFLLMFCLAGLLFTGCASIADGSKQVVTITSNVDGVEVIMFNPKGKEGKKEIVLGMTPLTMVSVPRVKFAILKFNKEGYKPLELPMNTEMNGWFLGNILCGGTIGSSTDYSSGAMYKYSPNSFMANLVPDVKNKAELEMFRKESEMRYFSMMNYDRLNRDIAVGEGEYLNTLYEMYGAKSVGDRARLLVYLKDSQRRAKSIPEFAAFLTAEL